MSQPVRIAPVRREGTPEWRVAWDALDGIERIAAVTVRGGSDLAAAEIMDAVQRARMLLTDQLR